MDYERLYAAHIRRSIKRANRLAKLAGLPERCVLDSEAEANVTSQPAYRPVCLDSFQKTTSVLLSTGRGQKTRLWAVAELVGSRQTVSQASPGAGMRQAELYVLAFYILLTALRATLERAMQCLGIR